MKQSFWIVFASCLLLAACTNTGATNAENEDVHVAQGHVGHGGGGGL
ncbi:hypothetical protein [Legionella norrlandica]|nr:hypothetical protein [Legionella norrlandica]